jgi:hypothetical protein
LEVLLSQQEVFYAVQYCFGLVVSHAARRHPHLATQQKLGLLPQRGLGLGAADYFVADVHRSSLMDDLIRRSAANLLAISLALANDVGGDAYEDIVASGDKPSALSDDSLATVGEETLEFDQK